ncbi:transposase [Bacillus cytotoxicus]|uniref:transposase n=1 Tax=Bacillus cereus group sp. BfR-BA-01492 TaxID=2920361 RepID=UPI002ABABE62|nr:transposase [Bacillus cytotoxicus]
MTQKKCDSFQFFTDAIQRRRRYLGETKKQHKSRFIDRCLACKPEQLTDEERGFIVQWYQEHLYIKYIYQALNHMRYVLKVTVLTQAKRRLSEWFNRCQFHMCGAVSKIAKTLTVRKQVILNTIISPLSNGIMEGTNNKIKLIKRRGVGYRNDAHFFLRLRLETGR